MNHYKNWLYISKCLLLVLFAGIFGIISRQIEFLPRFINLYAGDILWAFGAFFLIKAFFRGKTDLIISVYTLLFSFLIEFSQLFHPWWLNKIRDNIIGGLALGYGFHFTDLICYAVGALLGYLIVNLFKTFFNES